MLKVNFTVVGKGIKAGIVALAGEVCDSVVGLPQKPVRVLQDDFHSVKR